MPLEQGRSRAVVGRNIREMEASGHPRRQAVAAALHTADESKTMPTAHTAAQEHAEHPHEFSAAGRRQEAKEGEAMPDGSFPIANLQDLEDALRDVGRSHDPEAVRRHIIERARKLGLTEHLPAGFEERKSYTPRRKSVPDVNGPVAGAEMRENAEEGRDAEKIPHGAQHLGDVHAALGQVKGMMEDEEPAIDNPTVEKGHKRIKSYLTKALNCAADHFAKAYPDLEPLERHDEEEHEEEETKDEADGVAVGDDREREPTAEEKALLSKQLKALKELAAANAQALKRATGRR